MIHWSMPGVLSITFDRRKLQGTASVVDPLMIHKIQGVKIHGDVLLFVPFCWLFSGILI